MDLSLREKQSLFAQLLYKFLKKVYGLGYEVTLGEAYRTKEQAAWNAEKGIGIKNSLHCLRLAIDLNVFKDGKYLSKTADLLPLGEVWESMHELATWGGRFGDGNHFSLTHGGRR